MQTELASSIQRIMVTDSFLISFVYRLEQSTIAVNLRADVLINNDPFYYIVRNIRAHHHGSTPAIPEVRLSKVGSVWVHFDSQKPTALTMCIGTAIDALEQQ